MRKKNLVRSKQYSRKRHLCRSHNQQGSLLKGTADETSVPAEVTRQELVVEGVPYAADLLARSREQWQLGDWRSLAQIEQEHIQFHPERIKLALLIASGHQQLGDMEAVCKFVRLAKNWGGDNRLVSQILISGVYHTLGKASALAGHTQRAFRHFENAFSSCAPGIKARLHLRRHIHDQFELLGLPFRDEVSSPVGSKLEAAGLTIEARPVAADAVARDEAPTPVKTAPPKKNAAATAPNHKFSSDANIDNMIKDITPFFYKRSITYVDIGAFVGEVFLKLHTCNDIKIMEAHLYEPNPESYQKLLKNIEPCNMHSLHAYNFAISNKADVKLFSSCKSMTKIIKIPFGSTAVSNMFVSKSYRLDDISAMYTDKHIGFLKIDVEGEEVDVLTSANMLLSEQHIDMIYIEVGLDRDCTQQTYLGKIDSLLQNYGYRIFKIYEQINEWAQDSPLLRRCNILYMSSRFANANPLQAILEIHRLEKALADLEGSEPKPT